MKTYKVKRTHVYETSAVRCDSCQKEQANDDGSWAYRDRVFMPRGWELVGAEDNAFCKECYSTFVQEFLGRVKKPAPVAPTPKKADPYAANRSLEQSMMKNYEVD